MGGRTERIARAHPLLIRSCARCSHEQFKLATHMHPSVAFATDLDLLPSVLTMEREGCAVGGPCPGTKPCLACCAFDERCKDGMHLHAGATPLAAAAGSLRTAHPGCIGFTTQPALAGGWTPTLTVMERSPAQQWSALAKIEGPTCFGGCSELCFSSKFTVSRLQPLPMHTTAHKVGELATIVKRKPHNLAGALREMVTDADIYTLEFNPSMPITPQQKATLLATLILADYMYFEHDSSMCDGTGCNLCLVHCGGCVCPISLRKGGGGRQGSVSGGSGFRADQ